MYPGRNYFIVSTLRIKNFALMWSIFFFYLPVILIFPIHGARGEMIEVKTQNGDTIEFKQDYHALVVGVENYTHWPRRTDAVKTASDLSWELQRLGVMVEFVADPTASQLQSALEEFTYRTGKASEQGLIFYYCGHSQTLQSKAGDKMGWIVPQDAPLPQQDLLQFKQKAVSSESIAAMADQIQSRQVLFLFDAPFSADNFHLEAFLLRMVDGKSLRAVRQFISSGDVPLSNTYFEKNIAHGLQGEADLINDSIICASELSLFLQNRVGNFADVRSDIQWGRVAVGSDQGGDFIFKQPRKLSQIARLFIEPHPADAIIQLQKNKKVKFIQGMILASGTYKITVSAKNYETVEKRVLLAAGKEQRIKIQLPAEPEEMTNFLGMRFARIRPGRFMMGSPADEPGHLNDEADHSVRLTDRFYMQTAEVTVRQFRKFAQSVEYITEAEKGAGCWIIDTGHGWARKQGTNWQKPGKNKAEPDMPVRCVSWNDAIAFINWLNKQERLKYQLPTEAQWEYAARAGTTTPFSTGRCLNNDKANYDNVGHSYPDCPSFLPHHQRPVRADLLPPNPWKLRNMHGNVSEWCLDWYAPYDTDKENNPKGPKSGSERVIRGGHWKANADLCRSAKRQRFPPSFAVDVVGFRLVMHP